ncbi:MAG TPA: acetylxylan esterase, partial [Planctomycetaceae bacterium]
MKLSLLRNSLCSMLLLASVAAPSQGADLPPVSELKPIAELPDPLVMFDGSKVSSPEQWIKKRRPELIELFQYYMYGRPPAAPKMFSTVIHGVDAKCFGGKATKKEVTISFGPPQAPKLELLLV